MSTFLQFTILSLDTSIGVPTDQVALGSITDTITIRADAHKASMVEADTNIVTLGHSAGFVCADVVAGDDGILYSTATHSDPIVDVIANHITFAGIVCDPITIDADDRVGDRCAGRVNGSILELNTDLEVSYNHALNDSIVSSFNSEAITQLPIADQVSLACRSPDGGAIIGDGR